MKILPDKKLSDKEILIALTKGNIIRGTEASICESDKYYSVYKIFSTDGTIKPMSENKEKKISILFEKDLDFSTKIFSTLSYKGMIIGYEISYDELLKSEKIFNFAYNKELLIYYLRKTKEILEYFKENDIIYGDIADRNILFNKNNGNIIFCDMDNVQIGYYQMDLIPMDLFDYKNLRGIDYGVHPFMHNKMLLRSFGYDEYLITNAQIKKILKNPSKKIINSMLNPEFFDEKYLIDYIKKLSK